MKEDKIEETKMKNISLKEMLDILVDCVLNNKERPTFYYRREWETGHWDFVKISDVDLLDTRYTTWDDDFSEFEWEIKKSNIYRLED